MNKNFFIISDKIKKLKNVLRISSVDLNSLNFLNLNYPQIRRFTHLLFSKNVMTDKKKKSESKYFRH